MQIPANTLLSLQFIRFFAAIFVVFAHLEISNISGHYGVDLFFVLSGYVIAMLIMRGENPFKFIKNRAIRVMPLYWLTTFLIFMVNVFYRDFHPMISHSYEQLYKSLLFIPYFKQNGDFFPLYFIGWTMNYEVFFYFCAFLCLFLKIGPAQKLIALVILMLTIVLISHFLPQNYAYPKLLSNKISIEFLYGILSFYLFERYKNRLSIHHYWLFFIVITLLVVMNLLGNRGTGLYRAFVYGVPCFIIVLAALFLEQKIQVLPLIYKKIIFILGEACYAIYLTHLILIFCWLKFIEPIAPFFNSKGFIGAILIICGSIFVGVITHFYIEKPMMRNLRRL